MQVRTVVPVLLVIPAVGAVLGSAKPEPDALVHPLTVCVTVYVPAMLTMIEDVVSFVLHNKVPEAVVDKVDVPLQLFVTLTTGVGTTSGCAIVAVQVVVQPLASVVVTVYVPSARPVNIPVVAPVVFPPEIV